MTFYVTIEANFAFCQHCLMKLKIYHIAVLTAATLVLSVVEAHAQDDRGGFETDSPIKEGTKQETDGYSSSESLEIRSNRTMPGSASETAVAREQEPKTVKPAPKTPDKVQKEDPKKREQDPLSFNFLFYIIEKFKLSDIVE